MTDTRTLADLGRGESATVVAFDPTASPDITVRLRHLGFRPGQTVVKTRVAPLGDPAVYELLGYEMCLRAREAEAAAAADDPQVMADLCGQGMSPLGVIGIADTPRPGGAAAARRTPGPRDRGAAHHR